MVRCSKKNLPTQHGIFISLARVDHTSFLDKQTNKKQFRKRFSNIKSKVNNTEENEKTHTHTKKLFLNYWEKITHLLSVLNKI